MKDKTKKEILWVTGVFFLWRLFLVLVALLAINFFPLNKGFLGGGAQAYLTNPLLWSWANFDGAHYLLIAERGYGQFQQAFFPIFPVLIRFLTLLTGNYLASGLLISSVSSLTAVYLFYQLSAMDFGRKIAKKSVLYLLLFPASFFLVSVYSESLFLTFVLGSFLAAKKRRWGLAGVLGAFAGATRFVGVFLFPALVYEWWVCQKETRKRKYKDLLPLFLIVFGLLAYMGYLQKTTGDPFYFIHVQPFFGAERTGGKFILLHQVFWRYFKMLFLVEKWTPTYFVVVLEALTGGLFFLLSIFTCLRRWFSYLIFMALAFEVPTLSGTLSSMPRYVLVLFPGFILLAIWGEKYRPVRFLYPLMVLPLLIISLLFFTRGYFIA